MGNCQRGGSSKFHSWAILEHMIICWLYICFLCCITGTSARGLSNNLKRISIWAFQWKKSFSPDPGKQAQEVIFSCKLKKVSHLPLIFDNTNVSKCKSQRHLDIILDSKLIFNEHSKTVFSKRHRTRGLLLELKNLLPRAAFITIYKTFVRPHLVYGDGLFD